MSDQNPNQQASNSKQLRATAAVFVPTLRAAAQPAPQSQPQINHQMAQYGNYYPEQNFVYPQGGFPMYGTPMYPQQQQYGGRGNYGGANHYNKQQGGFQQQQTNPYQGAQQQQQAQQAQQQGQTEVASPGTSPAEAPAVPATAAAVTTGGAHESAKGNGKGKDNNSNNSSTNGKKNSILEPIAAKVAEKAAKPVAAGAATKADNAAVKVGDVAVPAPPTAPTPKDTVTPPPVPEATAGAAAAVPKETKPAESAAAVTAAAAETKPAEATSTWRSEANAAATAAAAAAKAAEVAAAAEQASDWSRGKTIVDPFANGVPRNDGRLRYDRLAMLALFVPKSCVVPDRIKQMYETYCNRERAPMGYDNFLRGEKHGHGNNHKNNNNNNNNSDELKVTAKDIEEFQAHLTTGFHYDPTRLSDDSTKPEVTLNKANLTLNKLSVEKFDKLSDEFLALDLYREELIDKAVDMIVNKAQVQAPFAFMYANLCRKITDAWNQMPLPTASSSSAAGGATSGSPSSPSPEGDEESANGPTTYGKLFKTKLLLRCGDEFHVDRQAAIEAIRQQTDIPEEDREENEVKLKTRFGGHMKFVGELYHNDLLSTKHVLECLEDDFLPKNDDESLVCMVKLFETLGKRLEERCAKKKDKMNKLNEIFDAIGSMCDDKSRNISMRVQCLIKILIDLRANKWVPRIKQLKAGKVDRSASGTPNPPTTGGSFGKGNTATNSNASKQGGNKQGSNNNSNSDWQTVQTKPGRFGSTGPSKPTFGARGTSGSGSSTPTSGDARKATGGKFSALGEQRSTSSPSKWGSKDNLAGSAGGRDAGASRSSSLPAPKSGAFGALNDDDDEGEEDIEAEDAELVPATSLPEDIVNSLKGRAQAFLKAVVLEDQAVTDIDEVLRSVSSKENATAISIKYLLSMVMDGKESDRHNICSLFAALVAKNVVTAAQFAEGLHIFLNDFDDLLIDTPHLLGYLAFILARCCALNKIANLSAVFNIPEDNLFACSSYFGPLIAETLRQVVALSPAESSSSSSAAEAAAQPAAGGLECAREMYKSSGVDFNAYVMAGRGETAEQALAAFLAKYKITDVVLGSSTGAAAI